LPSALGRRPKELLKSSGEWPSSAGSFEN
jgi:hypothetical protein